MIAPGKRCLMPDDSRIIAHDKAVAEKENR
jgi:hypothetical protein